MPSDPTHHSHDPRLTLQRRDDSGQTDVVRLHVVLLTLQLVDALLVLLVPRRLPVSHLLLHQSGGLVHLLHQAHHLVVLSLAVQSALSHLPHDGATHLDLRPHHRLVQLRLAVALHRQNLPLLLRDDLLQALVLRDREAAHWRVQLRQVVRRRLLRLNPQLMLHAR